MALGFRFSTEGVAAETLAGGVAEEIECGDLYGLGRADVVAIGNEGSPGTWLYFRE